MARTTLTKKNLSKAITLMAVATVASGMTGIVSYAEGEENNSNDAAQEQAAEETVTETVAKDLTKEEAESKAEEIREEHSNDANTSVSVESNGNTKDVEITVDSDSLSKDNLTKSEADQEVAQYKEANTVTSSSVTADENHTAELNVTGTKAEAEAALSNFTNEYANVQNGSVTANTQSSDVSLEGKTEAEIAAEIANYNSQADTSAVVKSQTEIMTSKEETATTSAEKDQKIAALQADGYTITNTTDTVNKDRIVSTTTGQTVEHDTENDANKAKTTLESKSTEDTTVAVSINKTAKDVEITVDSNSLSVDNLTKSEADQKVAQYRESNTVTSSSVTADTAHTKELNVTGTKAEAEAALSNFRNEYANVQNGTVTANTQASDVSLEGKTEVEIAAEIANYNGQAGTSATLKSKTEIKVTDTKTATTSSGKDQAIAELEAAGYAENDITVTDTVNKERVESTTPGTTTNYTTKTAAEAAKTALENTSTEDTTVTAEIEIKREEKIDKKTVNSQEFDTQKEAEDYADTLRKSNKLNETIKTQVTEKTFTNYYSVNNGTPGNGPHNVNLFVRIDNSVPVETGTPDSKYENSEYYFVGTANLASNSTIFDSNAQNFGLADLVKLNNSIGATLTNININQNLQLKEGYSVLWYVSKVQNDNAVNGKPGCTYHVDGVVRKTSDVSEVKYYVISTTENNITQISYNLNSTTTVYGHDYTVTGTKGTGTYDATLTVTAPVNYTATASGNMYKAEATGTHTETVSQDVWQVTPTTTVYGHDYTITGTKGTGTYDATLAVTAPVSYTATASGNMYKAEATGTHTEMKTVDLYDVKITTKTAKTVDENNGGGIVDDGSNNNDNNNNNNNNNNTAAGTSIGGGNGGGGNGGGAGASGSGRSAYNFGGTGAANTMIADAATPLAGTIEVVEAAAETEAAPAGVLGISDGKVPLNAVPFGVLGIADGPVPLAALPMTGDHRERNGLVFAASALSFFALGLMGKKREEEIA